MSNSTYDEKAALAAAFPDAVHQPNLSQSINASTKDLHDIVNQLIMSRLVLGLRDYRLYREGILSFYHVYRSFEAAWASLLADASALTPHTYSALVTLSDPRLARAPALAEDLSYLFGADGEFGFDADAEPATPQRKAVADHIARAIREKPHVLVAYAHSYYMALFAGGKVICRQVLHRDGFFPVHGAAHSDEEAKRAATNMFIFPVESGKEDGLRKKFKDAMVEVEKTLSEEEKTDIIAESRTIFKHNELLIRELDDICAKLAPPPPPKHLEQELLFATTTTTSSSTESRQGFVARNTKWFIAVLFVAMWFLFKFSRD